MVSAEQFYDPGRKVPFVGRSMELEELLRDVHRQSRTRWLVSGENGVGKTRLMQEAALSVGDRCRFFHLRGVAADGEEPPVVEAELLSGEPGASLLVLDDIDSSPQSEWPAQKILEWASSGPVLMTATNLDRLEEWERRWGPMKRMALSGFTEAERDRFFEAAGLPPSGYEIAAAFGRRMGGWNPAQLLQYAEVLKLERTASTLETILGPDGFPLLSSGDLAKVEISARSLSDALIAELTSRPELMREVSPRTFEELVAELYSRSGFEVELTRASKDGGVDIYAVQRAPFGSFLTIVDCKRNRVDRPVEVGLIRALYGTVMSTDASVGVIATTSYFSKGARSYQEERPHRLGLQDFASLRNMLRQPPR